MSTYSSQSRRMFFKSEFQILSKNIGTASKFNALGCWREANSRLKTHNNGATVQKFVARSTWCSGFLHPWFEVSVILLLFVSCVCNWNLEYIICKWDLNVVLNSSKENLKTTIREVCVGRWLVYTLGKYVLRTEGEWNWRQTGCSTSGFNYQDVGQALVMSFNIVRITVSRRTRWTICKFIPK
jgi:hypothetical protein